MPNTIATPSLTLEITEDLNQDGVISAAERSGLVGLRVTLPGSAQVGDLLVVTDGAGHQLSKQLDATDLANGQLAGDVFALPPDGQTFSATVQLLAPDGSVRDSASSSALVGPGDPPPTLAAPVLQIIEDSNGDGVISAAELNGLIGVKALLPAGVQVGDTLYATDWTGNTVSKVLDANDIANGSLQGDVFTAPPDGQLFTISVTIVTAAGISSPAGTAQALMQSAAPPLPAPLVQIIEDSNGDGVLSASELNGLIGARVTLPAGVQVGDTLHAVDQSGYHVSKLIDAADIAAGFLQGEVFQAPADGQTFSLSVTIVTAAGVSSAAGTASVLLQLAPPAGPVVSLDGARDAVGPIEGDVAPGGVTDTGLLIFRGTGTSGHTVTLFDGAVPLGSTVVGSDGQWTFTPDPALADGAHQITAVATDANGLSGAPSAALGFTVDTVAPEQPWVELLNDSDNDGLLSAAEQAAAARVDVRVTLPPDAQAGDTLLLVSQDGQRVDHVLSATELQQGSLVLNGVFALPPAGTPVIVQVGLQDRAGNLSLLSEDFAVVQRAPLAAPLVQILEDANNDGVISAGEAQGALDYRVTLPAGAEVGDLLKIDYSVAGETGLVRTGSAFVFIDGDLLATGVLLLGGGPDDPPVPAPGETVSISAAVITPMGEFSAVGSDSALREDSGVMAVPDVAQASAQQAASYFYGALDGTYGRVDTATGLRTTLGRHTSAVYDVALSATGHLFLVDQAGGLYDAGAVLGTAASSASASRTWVANLGSVNGLAAGQDGMLYAVGTSDGRVVSVNPATGVVQALGTFGVGSAGDVVVFNNALYMASNTGKLLQFDLGSHAVQVVVSGLPTNIYGLGLNDQGGLLAVTAQGVFYKVDLDQGSFARTGVTSTGSSTYGLASTALNGQFAPPITGDVTPGTSGQDSDPAGGVLQVVGVVAGTAAAAQGHVGAALVGTYGVLTLAADGQYSYAVDNSLAATRSLSANTVGVDVFTYTVAGASGSTATTTLSIDVLKPAPSLVTPLVLDLDGNGVQTTHLADGVVFDIAANGQPQRTAWVDTHDGLLVLDRNGNGTVDSGAELFGSATLLASGVAAKDGFAALAEMDSNGDGAVTAADHGFDQLQVWVDANHDGMSQAGELRSLAELGITALALDAQAGPGLQNGNLLALQASFRTADGADGADHALVDVWFAVDGSGPVAAAADGAVAADAASGLPGLAELVGSSAHDSVDVLLSGAGLPAPDAPICLAPEADLPSAHILPASLSGGDQLLALQAHA